MEMLIIYIENNVLSFNFDLMDKNLIYIKVNFNVKNFDIKQDIFEKSKKSYRYRCIKSLEYFY